MQNRLQLSVLPERVQPPDGDRSRGSRLRARQRLDYRNSTKFAGEVVVDDNAIVSANVLVHQFCHIAGYDVLVVARRIVGEILAQMGRQKMVEKRGLEDAALAYENHDTAYCRCGFPG